jgi:uncharacterized C2H2 Zn-finger protein
MYTCENCGKACRDNTDYTRHLRTHTGERTYVCPICNEAFNRNSTLTRHLKSCGLSKSSGHMAGRETIPIRDTDADAPSTSAAVGLLGRLSTTQKRKRPTTESVPAVNEGDVVKRANVAAVNDEPTNSKLQGPPKKLEVRYTCLVVLLFPFSRKRSRKNLLFFI